MCHLTSAAGVELGRSVELRLNVLKAGKVSCVLQQINNLIYGIWKLNVCDYEERIKCKLNCIARTLEIMRIFMTKFIAYVQAPDQKLTSPQYSCCDTFTYVLQRNDSIHFSVALEYPEILIRTLKLISRTT